ncbi:MAG TPA: VCBS repeat-containing protein, partial [Pyrinomonadaceae bacterium]|nr:VCBS repeat-containing protein [Pyrinomonadaceae bacterium]
MFHGKMTKNFCGLLLLACLSIFLQIEIAAQCGGTYFKRSLTTLFQINGSLNYTADMTGDGIPDLVGTKTISGQSSTNQFLFLPSDGNGGFGTPFTLTTPNDIVSYTLGDFDSDNLKDLFVRFEFPTPNFRIYKNNGNGTFTQFASQTGQGGLSALFLTDINNDGKGDLISYTSFNGAVSRLLGNGDGTFQNSVQINGGLYGMSKGDFNADGLPDFIAGTNLLINQGSGNFSTVSNVITFFFNERVSDVRDYNGDGKADIVTYKRSQPPSISLHLNNGNNTFQRMEFPVNTDQPNLDIEGSVIAGNFSGNASPDIIYSSGRYNQTYVFTNDGAGNLSLQIFKYRFNGNLFLTGDYDNDGKTDSLVLSPSFDTNPRIFQEITINFQKNVCNPVGQTRLVDFDASATTDYSYWTPDTGWWGYQGNTNSNRNFVPFGSGSLGDIPAPGDFDGDGATDITVYRNSNGVWWIKRSSDQQAVAVQFGLPGDKPVVGDYDGDSISDVAVWRPSDGNWYILFMGTQSYTVVHWGQDGDKPVPADYDGDGKIDLAVFRTSTGTWYYLKSSDLSLGVLQFGLGTDKPVPAD